MIENRIVAKEFAGFARFPLSAVVGSLIGRTRKEHFCIFSLRKFLVFHDNFASQLIRGWEDGGPEKKKNHSLKKSKSGWGFVAGVG